jgi:single-strand DNA-binding protein
MASVAKKENLSIAIREYQDNQGQTKKVWKTIGELVTWDDGRQSFEMWGPTGSTRGSVFDQDNQQSGYNQQPQQAPQQRQQPPQQNRGSGQNTGQPVPQAPAQPARGGFDDFDDDIPF